MEAIPGHQFLIAIPMKWRGFSSGVRPTSSSRAIAEYPLSAQPQDAEVRIAPGLRSLHNFWSYHEIILVMRMM
jgi:hypothetical protein